MYDLHRYPHCTSVEHKRALDALIQNSICSFVFFHAILINSLTRMRVRRVPWYLDVMSCSVDTFPVYSENKMGSSSQELLMNGNGSVATINDNDGKKVWQRNYSAAPARIPVKAYTVFIQCTFLGQLQVSRYARMLDSVVLALCSEYVITISQITCDISLLRISSHSAISPMYHLCALDSSLQS